MTHRFGDMVSSLDKNDFDIIRGYVLDIVRAEYGPLIQSLQSQFEDKEQPEAETFGEDYSPGTGEPVDHIGEFIQNVLGSIGIDAKVTEEPKADRHDQHLRFHALQMALAWLSQDGNLGEPVVLANLFYGFLKGE